MKEFFEDYITWMFAVTIVIVVVGLVFISINGGK